MTSISYAIDLDPMEQQRQQSTHHQLHEQWGDSSQDLEALLVDRFVPNHIGCAATAPSVRLAPGLSTSVPVSDDDNSERNDDVSEEGSISPLPISWVESHDYMDTLMKNLHVMLEPANLNDDNGIDLRSSHDPSLDVAEADPTSFSDCPQQSLKTSAMISPSNSFSSLDYEQSCSSSEQMTNEEAGWSFSRSSSLWPCQTGTSPCFDQELTSSPSSSRADPAATPEMQEQAPVSSRAEINAIDWRSQVAIPDAEQAVSSSSSSSSPTSIDNDSVLQHQSEQEEPAHLGRPLFSRSTKDRTYTYGIGDMDVLFFQGNRSHASTGVQLYLDLVRQYQGSYGRTKSRKTKGAIKRQIMDYMLYRVEARFVREDRKYHKTKTGKQSAAAAAAGAGGGGRYYLLTQKEVLDAISNSLWYACFKYKNNNNSSSRSSGGGGSSKSTKRSNQTRERGRPHSFSNDQPNNN